MRVTNKMMMASVTSSLHRNTQSLVRLSEKLATGKEINRPSDDPVGLAKVMGLQNSISKIDQYRTNISRGKMFIETTESTLDAVEEYIDMARDIAVDQSIGKLDTRDEAAEQLKNIYDQVLQLANSKYGNGYLFAGNQSNVRPFDSNADGIDGTSDDYETLYGGDDGELNIMIADGSTVKVDLNGNEVFTGVGVTGGVNVFDAMEDLIDGLENPDTAAGTIQIANQVTVLEQAQEQVNSARTRSAGTYERLAVTETYWEDFKCRLEEQLSGIWDTDLDETSVALQYQETVYETTISLAGEILNSNLMNFLR